MSHYSLNTTVSSSEAEALKEMIFKRAQERAAVLNEETQTSYKNAVQNDVMELARDSFVSAKNPFSMSVEPVKEKEVSDVDTSEGNKNYEIGFAQRNIDEIKSRIHYRNRDLNTDMTAREIESNMEDTRLDFGRKNSFMGALNFLNSQATISLVEREGASFEALA